MKQLIIIKRNLVNLVKTWFIIMSGIFTAFSVIMLFVTWDDLKISKMCHKIGLFISIIVTALLLAFIWVCFLKRKKTVWENGSGKVTVCYDDIMKIAFPKRNKKNKIVVVQVNTCFDTQVDENVARYDKPLVSPRSIHGKWINKLIAVGNSKEQIDSSIDEYIERIGINPIRELTGDEKSRGKNKCYSNGTIAVVEGSNKITYFLLAVSEFDEHNKAQSSKETIIESLIKLLDFYNDHGQGFDMYVTLAGTGLSRSGMSHEESLNTMKSVFQLYSDKIHGNINIVIYPKDKDKVSIYN